MKIKCLDIEYFRCFKEYSVEFAAQNTILIGKNGAGKSTLINAIHKALSFIFKKETSNRNDKTLTFGVTSLRVESFNKKTDLVRNYSTGLAYLYISIKAEAQFNNVPLNWEMYASTSTFSIQPKKYSEAFSEFIQLVNSTNVYPLLAFYSDSFPHISSNKTEYSKESTLRNFGYYQWNEESACSSIWIEKLKGAWKAREDRKSVV